ncbi:UvrD-helicase domain-containing protein [Sporosarcina limicola]|uniref:DNA helicase-2/ATP-dependent DNA helicase PcrA n=1 Tax=Sporosarcina limicola TaxID=34101 RepID=A0A927R523_9BACL|nr:UvrD-helicase domain-containing protein [Sporosarcina limicola]MBE1556861.1 DNA helicase-2/ATP-dependent DNA helicase PcrA [Sporosarcina limicola]
MVERRLDLEYEVQQIFNHIDNESDFLLSGGAGSGKTYSLVKVINQALLENPTDRIACITYTNAAVTEIEGRIQHGNLTVSTIHKFLWDNIKSFQIELKKVLIELINEKTHKRLILSEHVDSDYFNGKTIQYKEYMLIKEGIISHDEILVLANLMFENYPKLCKIVKDRFKFIFIDEYQDTDEIVVEIFLNHLKKGKGQNIIGFFGDAMQSIYDSGIGDLKGYISEGKIKEVKKKQNRRNPRLVIDLANKLRTDGIVQEPSADSTAPNMKNGSIKTGKIRFYYSTNEDKLNQLKKELKWDFTNSKETKELNLTHNLIAPQAGFNELMKIYDGDKILEYKDRIVKYIKNVDDKTEFDGYSFGEVLDTLLKGKIGVQQKPILPTKGMREFINENLELYENAKNIPFNSFSKIYLDKAMLLDDKKDDSDDPSKPSSKRDEIINHLFKIQDNISLYKQGEYNEFLRKTEFKIRSIKDKLEIKRIIEEMQDMSNKKIGEVIEFAHQNRICRKDDNFNSFIEKKSYVYDRLKEVKFKEFQDLFAYLNGNTPFSTQHKIKGEEYNNVLVLLDNGNWPNYNFEYLFDDNIFNSLPTGKGLSYPNILERTEKLFYVCCTRAKEDLVVYYHNPTPPVIDKAKSWFGLSNVHPI